MGFSIDFDPNTCVEFCRSHEGVAREWAASSHSQESKDGTAILTKFLVEVVDSVGGC